MSVKKKRNTCATLKLKPAAAVQPEDDSAMMLQVMSDQIQAHQIDLLKRFSEAAHLAIYRATMDVHKTIGAARAL